MIVAEMQNNVNWLIERIDAMRQATESRAAIVFSADAIIIAGIVFLLDKAILSSSMIACNSFLKLMLILCLTVSIIFLLISVVLATTAIVNIFTTSRSLLDKRIPRRIFLHSFDTKSVYPDFESFKEGFLTISADDLFEASLSHLWATHHLYIKRYLALRNSIRTLLISVALFAVSVFIVIYQISQS